MGPLFAIVAALAAQAPVAADELAPGWIVLEALDPQAAAGRRLLPLDDLLRGDRKPTARALLVLVASFEDLEVPAARAELESWAKEAAALGGWIVVLLRDVDQALARARRETPALRLGFVVCADGYGITRHALKLDRPGEVVVVNSSSKLVRLSSRELVSDEVRRAFFQALRRDKEDER